MATHDFQHRSLQVELAAAYDKIGDIQGGRYANHLGQRQKAREGYRKALKIREALLSAEPANVSVRRQGVVSEILIKTGRAAESIELLKKSLLTLQESFAHSPTDKIAHFRIGVVQAGLGKGYAALASDEKSSATKSLANWRAARSWFQKSQEIHKSFFDAGDLIGDDAARYELVNNGIKTCDAAIARLTGK